MRDVLWVRGWFDGLVNVLWMAAEVEMNRMLVRDVKNVCRAVLAGLGLLGMVMLAGCSVSAAKGPGYTPPPAVTINPAVVAKNVYYCGEGTVYVFAANQNGGVTPTGTVSPGGSAVTGDAAGTLYLGEANSVDAIAAGASSVSRTIQLPATETSGIYTMTTDVAGDLYLATRGGTIYVYGPTANGSDAPLRTITGLTLPTALSVTQMVVDAAGDLYVAEGQGYVGTQLVKFGPTASGAATPEIMTDSTYLPIGVALDAAGNVYISQSGINPVTIDYPSAIYEFAAGFEPGALPIRSIVGDNTGLGFHLFDLQIDAAGNIFVSQYLGNIEVFGVSANGNVAPASTLAFTQGDSTDTQIYLR